MPSFARFLQSPWRAAITLCALAFLIRLISIGLYPLQDTSEARYGEMARLMVETGDWITVWFDYNVPFWGKPPLFIWLSALSFKLFGINEFAARLPALLVSLGIVALTLKLALFQSGQSAGRLVLLILPSSAVFLVLSGTILADPVSLLAITLIMAGFWLGWHESCPKKARRWQYGFFVGCALALLAKGPAILVLAGLPIFFWCLPRRRLVTLWQRFPWFKGSLLTLLIAAPWYIAAEIKTPGFLDYFFIGEHLKRYLEPGWRGDKYGTAHIRPLGIIWPLWFLGALPWSLPLVALGLKAIRRFFQGQRKPLSDWQLFLLLWLLCPLVFFTFARNLIWTYSLPVVPAMALLLAASWQDKWSAWPKRVVAAASIMPLLLIAVTIVLINGGGKSSQKALLQKVYQNAPDNPAILYLGDMPFSARFYSSGQARAVANVDGLRKQLEQDRQTHFLVTKGENEGILPETIRRRFREITRYRDWILYQEKNASP